MGMRKFNNYFPHNSPEMSLRIKFICSSFIRLSLSLPLSRSCSLSLTHILWKYTLNPWVPPKQI